MATIPKIIHYVWLGKQEYTELTKKCMTTWEKKLPDYKIMRWDENNFDISECPYAFEAYQLKKYAFVSDYIRLKVLYEYGGIYLDTDVEVLKNFDDLLNEKGFAGFENNYALATSTIGVEKGNLIIKEFLEYYEQKKFIKENGEMDETPNPIPFTEICIRHGLELNGKEQLLKDIRIFSKEYFSPYNRANEMISTSENTFCIHLFNSSWMDNDRLEVVKKRKKIVKKYGKIIGYLYYGVYILKTKGVLKLYKEVLNFYGKSYKK